MSDELENEVIEEESRSEPSQSGRPPMPPMGGRPPKPPVDENGNPIAPPEECRPLHHEGRRPTKPPRSENEVAEDEELEEVFADLAED